MMRQRTACLVAALTLALAACARREAEPALGVCPCEEAGARPVDQTLMAWLARARTLHHLADRAEADGTIDRAIDSLEQLTRGPTLAGSAPEVDEVLADTYARLAELRARTGDLDGAEAAIVKGLERAPGATYFHGHLLDVRGLIYEKLSETLAKANKHAEAEEARLKAMRASLEAVRLQEEVIAGALDGGARGPAPTESGRARNERDR